MFTFIRNLVFGYKVSKKYGYSFKLNFDQIDAGCMNKYTKIIAVNIFSKHFNEIFLHEVGHVIDFKNGYHSKLKFKNISVRLDRYYWRYNYNNEGVIDSLGQETNASKFAIKALRKLKLDKKNSEEFLEYAFNTYLSKFNVLGLQIELANANSKFCKELKINRSKP